MTRTLLAALCGLALAAAAQAQEDTLARPLEARFKNDRTGVCVVAALIEGDAVKKSRYCALPRADGGPGFEAAFEIGSVSKTMTAFLVADLIAQGKWSLDDPIAKHLPAGAPVPRQDELQILVRDLLTHSAGLPPLPSRLRMANPADPYAALTEAQLLESLGDVKLAKPIGSSPAYSNFGMMVVSLAVARSLGTDLETALRERLFRPLKMDGAFIAKPPAGTVSAIGHLPSGAVTAPWTIATNLAGVGMVRARLDDMVRYAQAELGEDARMKRTQQPLAHGFGMNWILTNVVGHDLVVHEGGTGGFSSIVVLEPARRRAAIVLADTALTDLGGLSDVSLALLGVPVAQYGPRVATAPAPALRAAIQGDWNLAGLPLRIWDEQGRLMAQAQGQQAFELFYDSRGDFYPTLMSALLTPRMDKDGKVDRFLWRQGGGAMEAQRK